MPVLFPTTMMQEHKVNPIYEAFKKAGIRLTGPIGIDLTMEAADSLAQRGYLVVAEEQDSHPDSSEAASGQRYVYPDSYIDYVCNALNIESHYAFGRMGISSITLTRDGNTVIVEVTKD